MSDMDQFRQLAERVEVYRVESTTRSVSFKGWKARACGSTRSAGLGARVVAGGRVGTAGVSGSSDVGEVVRNAVDAARFGEQIDLSLPSGDGKGRSACSDGPLVYDERIPGIDAEELLRLGRELMRRLERYRGETDCDISVAAGESSARLRNSEGFDGGYRRTSLSLGASITRVKEGDIYHAHDHWSSPLMPEDPESVIDDLVARVDYFMEHRDRVVAAPKGRVPVVYSPHAVSALLTPLLAAVNGIHVASGASPLTDQLNRELFDSKLTIFDDGTLDGRAGSGPFDGEGVRRAAFPIFERGVLRNFLLDLRTGAKRGMPSTGSAQRGVFGPPHPAGSNLLVAAGDVPLEELLAGVREGILVESLLGVGQGNILSGAFSNPVAVGFRLENGEITGRVKNVAVAGNVHECLKEISAVGSEAIWPYATLRAPHIRLDNLSVVAAG